MEENPQPFTPRTLSTLGQNALAINDVASILGVSPLFIAAPIAREMNKTEVGDYDQGLRPVARLLALGHANTWSSKGLENDHKEVVRRNLGSDPGALRNILKFFDPTLNDVGTGKIQIGTAMDLVDRYGSDRQYAGLNLRKYVGHYDQLLHDMQAPATANGLAFALQGLVAKEATGFFAQKLGLGDNEAGLNAWSKLSKQTQTALVTAYSAMGRPLLERLANAQIDKNGSYAPDPLSSSGAGYVNHGSNFDDLQSALGQQAGGVGAGYASASETSGLPADPAGGLLKWLGGAPSILPDVGPTLGLSSLHGEADDDQRLTSGDRLAPNDVRYVSRIQRQPR